jgi:hypothetical protein
MKKRFVIWAIALTIFAGLDLYLWQWQHAPTRLGVITDQDIAEATKQLGGETEIPAPVTITPIDLKRPMRLAIGSLGGSDDDQNRILEDMVLAELTGVAGLDLVERQSLEAVLHEQNLTVSHLVRAADAVRVGRLLRADWFLLGTGANISGTNFIVVRLVDSHTGIMRDAGVFSTDGSPVKLAADLTEFVRQCRQDAANPKPKVYLAIGTFQDVSLNNRQAAFPTQLRAYLTAAYQEAGVSLLEREAADVLYREMQLDLVGLTENGATNPPSPLQSAYWLVNGDYQSYETTNFQVEVSLRIHRMLGRASKQTIRGPTNQSLFAMIKVAIDTKMKQDASPMLLSLANEANAQMQAGKELAGGGLVYLSGFEEIDDQEFARRQRNAEEAIQAFETVLLLQPTNREAKVRLAACFRNQTIARVGDSRNLYREILREPVQDKWVDFAQGALINSFQWSNPAEKEQWFAAAVLDETNTAAAGFFRQQALELGKERPANGSTEAVKLAEDKLLTTIRNEWGGRPHQAITLNDFYNMFSAYVDSYGTNRASAAKRLDELLPEMRQMATNYQPHLLACVVSFQVETNTSVLAEFEQSFDQCCEHPERMTKPQLYFFLTAGIDSQCVNLKLFQLAEKVSKGNMRAVAAGYVHGAGEDGRMGLAFAFMNNGRWEEALDIFESYSNMPVLMQNYGPWGSGSRPVLTEHWAADCRAKLDLPAVRDSREFMMGRTPVALCSCSSFTVEETGVWVATGNQLLRLDLDLKTNLIVNLPKGADTSITTLDVGTDKIWIGTEGDGLIEFDKASRQCRRLTVADGLLMNEICSTCLADDALWIGYGYKGDFAYWGDSHGNAGGIGYLNLSTHQLVSFSPSLAKGVDAIAHVNDVSYTQPVDQPPRRAVVAIAAGHSGDIWFVIRNGGSHRFQSRSNIWTAVPQLPAASCLTIHGDQLYAGQFRGLSGDDQGPLLGLRTFDFRNLEWRDFKAAAGLPRNAISALAADGSDLWVGGMGYLARVDLARGDIKKFAYIPAHHVDKIQVGGGYVWAQYDGYLYRTPVAIADNSDSSSSGKSQHEFLQGNFGKFVPFQFLKGANGAAVLQHLNVRDNLFERDGMFYCGFKFTIPTWTDGNLKLMYVLAKTEAQKNFVADHMDSQILSEDGPSQILYEHYRETLTSHPQLQAQFPYTTSLTTQTFDIKRLEPGKTYGIWFEFNKPALPDIAVAITINSPRGTNEFGILPMR